MPSSFASRLSYGVLLLVALQLPLVFAVCQSCFGGAEGCTDTGFENCPWQKLVLANVGVIKTSSASSALVLGTILAPKFLRLFSTRILSAIRSLHLRPKAGSVFDFSGKKLNAIMEAIKTTVCTKDEAESYYAELIDAQDDTTEEGLKKIEHYMGIISMIQKMTLPPIVPGFLTQGPLLFILAKLSHVVCIKEVLTFELCMECDQKDSNASSSSTSSTLPGHAKANLIRPKSLEQAVALLHHFQLLCVTLGFCSLPVLSTFLDDVFFEPLRSGASSWPLCFEVMILYLRKLEEKPGSYNLRTIISSLGGFDAVEREASILVKEHYVSSFRGPRGEPRDVTDNDKDKLYVGEVKGDNPNAKTGCTAWNGDKPHLAKNVDERGYCLYRHKCCQFVSDRGKNGQCLGTVGPADHKRKDCPYDASKKLKSPARQ